MSEHDQSIEWYLARDGRQHGPLSDAEMRKLAELGHLRPMDLVWRFGFENWVPAASVAELPLLKPVPAPEKPAPTAAVPAPAQPAPSGWGQGGTAPAPRPAAASAIGPSPQVSGGPRPQPANPQPAAPSRPEPKSALSAAPAPHKPLAAPLASEPRATMPGQPQPATVVSPAIGKPGFGAPGQAGPLPGNLPCSGPAAAPASPRPTQPGISAAQHAAMAWPAPQAPVTRAPAPAATAGPVMPGAAGAGPVMPGSATAGPVMPGPAARGPLDARPAPSRPRAAGSPGTEPLATLPPPAAAARRESPLASAAAAAALPEPRAPRPPPSGVATGPRIDTLPPPDAASAPEERARAPFGRIAAVLVLAIGTGAATAFWARGSLDFSQLTRLIRAAEPVAKEARVVRAPRDSGRETEDGKPMPRPAPAAAPARTTVVAVAPQAAPQPAAAASPPPLAQPLSDATELDARWQQAKLWQLIKRDFPEWYGQRLNETARLGAEKDEAAVAVSVTQALVKLRRENAGAALVAGPERLRAIAQSFLENLERLARHSTQACFAYISAGEQHPSILELSRTSDLYRNLQGQLVAIFEAVADGKRTPRQHGQAQREDFDELAAQLGRRGWTAADLQLFSDARALSRAPPERVCKMVGDWFAAQLDVKDEARQMRLLSETLKPIVAG